MYFSRISNVKNWKHSTTKHKVTVELDGKLRADINAENISQIKEEIGYFRKFNALHSYIVENYADGVDDCRPIYLSQEDFKEILKTLQKLIKTKNVELLPPFTGFFFGSTEVDEYYWADVKEAKKMIDDSLKNMSNITDTTGIDVYFEYQASW